MAHCGSARICSFSPTRRRHPRLLNTCSSALDVLQAVRTATVQEDADMVVGGLNCASWRRKSGSAQQMDNTLGEALKNGTLSVPDSSPLWGLGGIPSESTDVCCGLSSHPSLSEWLIRKHGAFEIDRQESGTSTKDQTSHDETWIHLSHASTLSVERESQQRQRTWDHSRHGRRRCRSNTSQR